MNGKKVVLASAITLALIVPVVYFTLEEQDLTEEKEVENAEPTTKTYERDPNLDSSVATFLTNWVQAKGEKLQTMILSDFDNVTGNYVYGASISKVDGKIELDLGLSKLTVNESKLTLYKGFEEQSLSLEDAEQGLAIVTYDSNDLKSIEFRNLEADLEHIRGAILATDLSVEVNSEESQTVQEKKYQDLTISDWRGLANLTIKEFTNKNLAPPMFLIPEQNIDVMEDLTENPNYIIVGEIVSSDEAKTKLRTIGDKVITIDISVGDAPKNKPVWLHLLVHEGKVENVTPQVFEGADLNKVINGVMEYKKSSK